MTDHSVKVAPSHSSSSSLKDAMGSQNLASVLNDPTVSRSQSEGIFTKDWGSYFIEMPVADASVSVSAEQLKFMKKYMKDVRRRAKLQNRLRVESQSSACSSHRANSITMSNDHEDIPSIFLQSGLDLAQEQTFQHILEYGGNSVDSNSSDYLSPQMVKEAQKNLSDILDLVEDQLSIQIGSKFREFFQIMTTMNTLMDQVSKTIKEVSSVRGKCDFLRESIIKPIMKNILLMKRKENLNAYLRTLNLMDSIFNSTSRASMLLSSKDYVGALDLTSSAREGISQKLPNVKCLNHLTAELQEKERLIEKLLDEELNKLLTSEWLQPMEPGTVLTPSKVAKSSVNVIEEDAIFSVIFGMLKIQKFAFVEKFYDQAKTAIITILKQTIILALAREELDVNNRSEDHLYNQLRQVDLKKWLNVLDCTFASVILLLKRIFAVNQIILKTIAVAADRGWDDEDESQDENEIPFLTTPKANLTQEQFIDWTKSTKDCLVSLCDFSQSRFTDLIEKRIGSDACNDRFTSSEFTHLARSIDEFSSVCYDICGQKSHKLLKLLQVQAAKFATKFHEEKKKKLDSLLDIEQWKSKDSVPRDFLNVVHQITSDNISSSLKNGYTLPDEKASASVHLQGEEFRLVPSVVLLITLLFEYGSTAAELKVLSYDLMNRLLELLTFFNDKTYALVYNGEAKQVAGLKSITSRTLVNAARALTLVIKLLPFVKKHFENIFAPPSNSTTTTTTNSSPSPSPNNFFSSSEGNCNRFDKVVQMYQQHVDKFFDKVVHSSREIIAAKLTKWEAKPPSPSPVFLAITHHLGVLLANLEESLPPKLLSEIFSRIDQSFKEALRVQIAKLNISKGYGPQYGHVIQEIVFYREFISKKCQVDSQLLTSDDLWSTGT